MGLKTAGAVGLLVLWLCSTSLPLLRLLRPPFLKIHDGSSLTKDGVRRGIPNQLAPYDIHAYVVTSRHVRLPFRGVRDPWVPDRVIPHFNDHSLDSILCSRERTDVHYMFSVRTKYAVRSEKLFSRTMEPRLLTTCADTALLPVLTGHWGHWKDPEPATLGFRIPPFLRKNETLHLLVLTTAVRSEDVTRVSSTQRSENLSPTWVFRHVMTPLTRIVTPAEIQKPKRFLLQDIKGDHQMEAIRNATGSSLLELRGSKFVALPRDISFTTIVEHRSLSEEVKNDPRLSTLLEKKGSDELVYMPPFIIDSMSSPRDESTLLMETNLSRICGMDIPNTFQHTVHVKLTGIVPSVKEMQKHLSVCFVGLGTWSLQQVMHQSFDDAGKLLGDDVAAYDVDSMKMMVCSLKQNALASPQVAGGNPILIFSTFVISCLHMIFSLLALSADVTYWKSFSQEAYEAISVSSIVLDVIFSGFIALYLFDAGRSFVILAFSCGKIGLDFWKLWKVWTFPAVSKQNNSKDDGVISTEELKRFETACVRKLIPIIAAFVVVVMAYQLVLVKQSGWWSWIISSLALCSYAGGFLTMTPQLFRNYKLQSVEHLAWATLTYQALNAFVDDFFAFIIRMPKMHQMSVFRDDVIFIIYSIQVSKKLCYVYTSTPQRYLYSRRRKIKQS